MRSSNIFPTLPDDARVWVYAADRPLNEAERQSLTERLHAFLSTWRTHGRTVRAEVAIEEDRFVLIGATVDGGDMSGCGIDASTGALKEAATELGFEWEPLLTVFYRDSEGRVRTLSRQEFRELAKSGQINAATRVFDPTIASIGQLRNQGFERPAGLSWHSRLLSTVSVC